MAPEKEVKKRVKLAEKYLKLWPKCQKAESVPSSYISLHSVERNFGVSIKVSFCVVKNIALHLISSQDLKQKEIHQVVYSSRGGQFGYFFPPKVKQLLFES